MIPTHTRMSADQWTKNLIGFLKDKYVGLTVADNVVQSAYSALLSLHPDAAFDRCLLVGEMQMVANVLQRFAAQCQVSFDSIK
jgi:hypothetical protein